MRVLSQLTARLGRLCAPREPDTVVTAMGYAYRMVAWPVLPPRWRTAPVLRALSRMSTGPVTHGWFLTQCCLPRDDAEGLLEWLVQAGALRRIDLVPEPSWR